VASATEPFAVRVGEFGNEGSGIRWGNESAGDAPRKS